MVIKRALEEPFRQIVVNAGLEGSVILDKVGTAGESTQSSRAVRAGEPQAIWRPNKSARISVHVTMTNLTIELDREADGRWIAEIEALPGTLAYGSSREEAIARAEALAFRVLAERLENGEPVPEVGFLFAVAG